MANLTDMKVHYYCNKQEFVAGEQPMDKVKYICEKIVKDFGQDLYIKLAHHELHMCKDTGFCYMAEMCKSTNGKWWIWSTELDGAVGDEKDRGKYVDHAGAVSFFMVAHKRMMQYAGKKDDGCGYDIAMRELEKHKGAVVLEGGAVGKRKRGSKGKKGSKGSKGLKGPKKGTKGRAKN